MKQIREKRARQLRRRRRVRARVRGTAERPRLSVFRSQRHLSAQLIDDGAGATLAAASDTEMVTSKGKRQPSRRERAEWVGAAIAAKAITQGIQAARFDRGRYRYHGLVAAFANGARKGGLRV